MAHEPNELPTPAAPGAKMGTTILTPAISERGLDLEKATAEQCERAIEMMAWYLVYFPDAGLVYKEFKIRPAIAQNRNSSRVSVKFDEATAGMFDSDGSLAAKNSAIGFIRGMLVEAAQEEDVSYRGNEANFTSLKALAKTLNAWAAKHDQSGRFFPATLSGHLYHIQHDPKFYAGKPEVGREV